MMRNIRRWPIFPGTVTVNFGVWHCHRSMVSSHILGPKASVPQPLNEKQRMMRQEFWRRENLLEAKVDYARLSTEAGT